MSDEHRMTRAEWHAAYLRSRDVDEACAKCHGLGVHYYSSTATWGGGMGGQSFTMDVCDACWGTGDQRRHGTDLRKMRRETQATVTKAAMTLLAESVGCNIASMRPAVLGIVNELDRLARGRKARPPWFVEACMALASKLRSGIEETP